MKTLSFILITLTFLSCRDDRQIYNFRGKTMGTYYSVKIVASDLDEQKIEAQIETLLKEVNLVFSTYLEGSEVSKINKHPSSTPLEITPVMKELLNLSEDIYLKSSGYFDPTVGPLVNLWGFGPNGKQKIPTEKNLEAKKKNVGFEKIFIQGNLLTKRDKDIYLDFSSIAKGQGVDDLSLVLESYGYKDYLIEIGGEVRARGKKPNGFFWAIGVEKPAQKLGQTIQKVINLENKSIATSGSYRNYLKYGDKVFSHTIDPKTGKPVTHKLVSVSVIDGSCARADGWATALMSMGPQKGLKLANELGLSAYFLVKDEQGFKELSSKKF